MLVESGKAPTDSALCLAAKVVEVDEPTTHLVLKILPQEEAGPSGENVSAVESVRKRKLKDTSFEDTKNPEVLRISNQLLSKVMPHQLDGIQFLLDNGSGAILAHSMGLGKSLQVVALAHTLLGSDVSQVSSLKSRFFMYIIPEG